MKPVLSLKDRRLALQLTQEELAFKVGIDQSQLSKAERLGEKAVGDHFLKRISDVLTQIESFVIAK